MKMNRNQANEFMENTVGRPVYPGHPLYIAFMIMKLYPDFQTATKKSDRSEYSNALSDSRIPGAGGCVYAAIDILADTIKNLRTAEEMIVLCDSTWRRHRQSDHANAIIPGIEQAKLLEPHFLEIADEWLVKNSKQHFAINKIGDTHAVG